MSPIVDLNVIGFLRRGWLPLLISYGNTVPVWVCANAYRL